MFLNIPQVQTIIDWVNSNPEAATLYFEVIAVFFGGIGSIFGWFLHGIKYKRDKRLEAKITIYPAIQRSSQLLEDALREHDRLYIPKEYNRDSDKGNIYTLYYSKSKRYYYSKSYHEIADEELKKYKSLAQNLEIELRSHKNCIHPEIFGKEKWNECTQILLSFCDFIIGIDSNYVGEYGKSQNSPNDKPIHIELCEKLIRAFEYIKRTI